MWFRAFKLIDFKGTASYSFFLQFPSELENGKFCIRGFRPVQATANDQTPDICSGSPTCLHAHATRLVSKPDQRRTSGLLALAGRMQAPIQKQLVRSSSTTCGSSNPRCRAHIRKALPAYRQLLTALCCYLLVPTYLTSYLPSSSSLLPYLPTYLLIYLPIYLTTFLPHGRLTALSAAYRPTSYRCYLLHTTYHLHAC